MPRNVLTAGLFAPLAFTACANPPPRDWGAFDMLQDATPAAEHTLRRVPVSAEDHAQLLEWGEGWFRDGAFGNERTVSDVMGVFGAEVTVPCPSGPDCREKRPVLPIFLASVDALDGVSGNLFTGNGGAYTSDLVLQFPEDTLLYGSIPVPSRLHSGLDIEAGKFLPIGIEAVMAPEAGASLPWLPDLSSTGMEGAPAGRVRLRLACAACHYSLDVDNDGTADLASADPRHPTPGSPFRPEDAWGVGNQDISFGWLFGLAANPLLGAPVLAGAIGTTGVPDARRFVEWTLANYQTSPEAVKREVVVGMLTQPRGFADVTTDGMFNPIQIPTLFTRGAWPSNSEGAQSNASDRNNTVWTGALDFTGLIDLCADRGSKIVPPGERASVFSALRCTEWADMMVRWSPAVMAEPARLAELTADILGESDGVPGLLDPSSMLIFQTLTIPREIAQSKPNLDAHRLWTAEQLGGDAGRRGNGVAALGMRIGVEPAAREKLEPYAEKYRLVVEDMMSEAVSLAMDAMDPPANNTKLLANAASLVPRGYRVFKEAGCESCHRGPFATDNVVHILSKDATRQFGAPRAPSTAGWRVPGRADGPAIETDPQRTWNTRPLRRLVSAPYDPATGESIAAGGPIRGLLSVQLSGYKTTALRYLWGSAPFLHDGGVAVSLRRGPAGDDLAALLARPSSDLIYGMGEPLSLGEPDPWSAPRPNAALSLQAMVLKDVRARVIEANLATTYAVPRGSRTSALPDKPVPERIAVADMAIRGVGHEFWVDDQPGGERVTALVAFLLALDDCPRQLPGGPDRPCPRTPVTYP